MLAYNKLILGVMNFKFPIFLTFLQMFLTSIVLCFATRGRDVPPFRLISRTEYTVFIIPIAFMFACSVVVRNFVYTQLSIAFIQMLTAIAPAAVFVASWLTGLEKLDWSLATVVSGACLGTAVASFGAVRMSSMGVAMQVVGICLEAWRAVTVRRCIVATDGHLDSLSLQQRSNPCWPCRSL